MRKMTWKIAVLTAMILLSGSTAFTQGIKGWFDLGYSTSTDYEDEQKLSETDTFNRNLYLNFHKSITEMLSYQINLRTNFTDTDLTDFDGNTSTTYRRSLEPALDVFFGNPAYDLSGGYRRQELWTTGHLSNEGRQTNEFYYSRFNLSPEALPTVNISFDEQKNYDHLEERQIDSTNTSYSIGSSYELPPQDVKARYAINYSHGINRTPLSTTSKTLLDNFNTNYNLGYAGRYRASLADYSINYQGNYSRSKSEQSVARPGSVINERVPLGGFYQQGTVLQPDVDDSLPSKGSLIDQDVNASTGIGLSSAAGDKFQNIGILVSSARSVDRLFIYVNKDIGAEVTLADMTNWKVFRSNFNRKGTWNTVSIKSVTIGIDNVNNTYRYEIEFLSSQNDSFYKAVNKDVSNVPGVFVTEIEAYGTDAPSGETLISATSSFNQGLNFNANLRPLARLSFQMNYSLDRSDNNPISIMDSVSGIFENIVSDSVSDEKWSFRSNISRNYGLAAIWLTHTFLTTNFRVQRNESFDNKEETDISSNTYTLSLNSSPLPTLDTTLSFVKNDSFSFGEKSSTNDNVLLSVGSKLYQDVNMITDVGYTQSEAFSTDTTSSSTQLTGSIDAAITRRISGNLNYGFIWTASDGSSSRSKNGSMIITYRPGKFVNISGTLTGDDSGGDVTTTEGLLIDWLPVRALRLNVNYLHSDSDPGPVKTDALAGYAIWYLTKFADARFAYGYSIQKSDKKTENYNFNTSINCRF